MKHKVTFHPSGRGKAQNPPHPDYPNGKAIHMGGEGPSCQVLLPYPASECGSWLIIKCNECRVSAIVTAAGRADDPTSVTIPCKEKSL